MKKPLLFAAAIAVSGLTLVSASPPPYSNPDDEAAYPPCSSTVTDRCIQLHERGVDSEDNLALNEDLGMNEPGPGLGGPLEDVGDPDMSEASAIIAADDYPPCSGSLRDRCVQGHEGGGATRTARAHRERATQLAMRAGERG